MSITLPAFFKDSPRNASWGKILSQFLVGQVGITLLTSLTGFLLLRWLPKDDFARYSFAFAMQGLIASLTDAGFSSAIVGLVGERADDPATVGRYVRAVTWFRSRIFVVTSLGALLILPFLCAQQNWTFWQQFHIIGSVLLTTAARGWAIYEPVLTINKRMKDMYQPQGVIGSTRLGVTALLHVAGQLGGGAAIWLNAVGDAAMNYIKFKKAETMVVLPDESDVETRQQMMRYVAPLTFSLIFSTFQGQIVTFLTTYFGSTTDLANASALFRLSAIFNIITFFAWHILEPYCARQSPDSFRRKYPLILAAMIAPLAASFLLSVVWVEPFVFILGEKYADLRSEIPFAVAAIAVTQFAFTLWAVNSSRRWVFWWYILAGIISTLITQVVCLLIFDMKILHNVLLLSLYTAIVSVGVSIFVGVYCSYIKPVSDAPISEETKESRNETEK